MIRFFRTGLILAGSALFASAGLGCAGSPTEPSRLTLGQPFELRRGSSAMLPDGLTIVFEDVKSDSRCPMNAICVWVGDATVAVSLSQVSGEPVARELHTFPASGSETSYLAYSISLVSLAPYPRTDRKIQPEDYVATLTVKAQ
jgi:hypothetical protein